MSKTISASNLRTNIRRVLNEVIYNQTDYLVEKFGEPVAAIISLEDYHLLQTAKQQQAPQAVSPGRP